VITFNCLRGAKKNHIYQICLPTAQQKKRHDLQTAESSDICEYIILQDFQDTREELTELSTPAFSFILTPMSQVLFKYLFIPKRRKVIYFSDPFLY